MFFILTPSQGNPDESKDPKTTMNSIGSQVSIKDKCQQVWTLFWSVLASFSERLVLAANNTDIVSHRLLVGIGAVSCLPVDCNGRHIEDTSFNMWKIMMNKLSHTLCHILNVMAYENAIATITTECVSEKV